jgi:hypothetical protein
VLALRRIDEGDRGGYLLAYSISTPLLHARRALDVRELWRRSAALFQRLYDTAGVNAGYARDPWVSYWRMATLAETLTGTDDSRAWWRLAREVLTRMKKRGAFMSPEDEGYLQQIEAKLGLP